MEGVVYVTHPLSLAFITFLSYTMRVGFLCYYHNDGTNTGKLFYDITHTGGK